MPISAKILLTAMQGAERVVTRCFNDSDEIELYLDGLEDKSIRGTIVESVSYKVTERRTRCCKRKVV